MEYDAITIDTNIFDENGLRLESGMLGQLTQFKAGSAQLILSEIIIREIHGHLKKNALKAQERFKSATKAVSENALLSSDKIDEINAIYDSALEPGKAVKERLQVFIDNTGVVIIPADGIDIKELIKKYFASSAPFAESGKKKNEFPDAIALMSLENWAENNNKKILAISTDGDWKNFADGSKCIDVEQDLASALEKFQKHAKKAEAAISNLLCSFDKGKNTDLFEQIISSIDLSISEMDFYVEASAAYHYELDGCNAIFGDADFTKYNDKYDFQIVQTGKDKIVVRVGLNIDAKIIADFSFSVWDSIDKEYVGMGSGSAERDEEFQAAALITFVGNFDEKDIDIEGFELIEAPDSFDFEEVSIDYGDHYYEE